MQINKVFEVKGDEVRFQKIAKIALNFKVL